MSGIEVGYRGQSPELIDVVNNNNKTASRMPKSGGDKKMSKKYGTDKQQAAFNAGYGYGHEIGRASCRERVSVKV